MKRLESSRSRSHSAIRQHSRKNHALENLIETSSKSNENSEKIENIDTNEKIEKSNETSMTFPKERKKYILSLKKYVQIFYEEKKIILN